MQNILEKIKKRGYEVKKSEYFNEDNPYAVNYGSLVIKTPSGAIKSIIGKLDAPLFIKDKTLKTSRRELIEAVYRPNENGWCILENGYDLLSKTVFDKAKSQIGLKNFKSEEEGEFIENETTKEFPTHFVNGEAYLTFNAKDEDYVVQLFHQADIDCFITDNYVFNHKPITEEFHIAYDLINFEFLLKTKRIKEVDEYGSHWTEKVEQYKRQLNDAYDLCQMCK